MPAVHGRGDAMPVATHTVRYPVVYPRPGQPLELLLLSDQWDGFSCHWIKDSADFRPRTIACTLPDMCDCAIRPLPHKWHGYTPAVDLRTGKRVCLTATERGVKALLRLTEGIASLAGSRVLLDRLTNHPSSSMTAQWSPKVWTMELPTVHDLLPTYISLYGQRAVTIWAERTKGKGGAR